MEMWENAKLAADRAWSANFYATDGQEWIGFYITGIDEKNRALLIEKVGERHKEPTLLFLKDLKQLTVNW